MQELACATPHGVPFRSIDDCPEQPHEGMDGGYIRGRPSDTRGVDFRNPWGLEPLTQNRSARYGVTSMLGIGPVIIPAMIRPVIGPATMPVCPCPNASHRFS